MWERGLTEHSFEHFTVSHLTDAKKRYHLALDPQFPFEIKLFCYDRLSPPFPLNWHERLEIFVPVAGEGTFLMGEVVTPFREGDVLVVDNMKLHGLGDFRGQPRYAMVITFLPEFVYTVGSPLCDSLFLIPFYAKSDVVPPIVHSNDRMSVPLQSALSRLAHCYLTTSGGLQYQAGCKAYLLEILYLLTIHFGWSETVRSEYLRRQEQSRLLGRLHDYLLQHCAEKIRISRVAALVGMSESKFMKYFKSATGQTFVSYLTRLRLQKAVQLLEESDLPIAQIASEVGFSDQSYFDRVFHRHFRHTPRAMRQGPG